METRRDSAEGVWNLLLSTVPINIRVEEPILLRLFAKRLSEPCDYDTVRKWSRRGLLIDRSNPKSKRVKLEVVQLPRGMATSWEAYARFLERLNGVPVK